MSERIISGKSILLRGGVVQDPHGTDPHHVVGADACRDPFLETRQRGIGLAGWEFGELPPKVKQSGGQCGGRRRHVS